MIAGTHKKLASIQSKTLPCMVCDKTVFYSGYGVDKLDFVHAQEYKKAIGLECLVELITNFLPTILKINKQLTAEQAKLIKDLELSNTEYLQELERMVPLAKSNRRLGFLFGYLEEAGKLDIQEDADSLLAQFKKDMNKISGVEN